MQQDKIVAKEAPEALEITEIIEMVVDFTDPANNRRKFAYSRTKVGLSQRRLKNEASKSEEVELSAKEIEKIQRATEAKISLSLRDKGWPATLLDYGRGGIGIRVEEGVANSLHDDDRVYVRYILNDERIAFWFFVRSVVGTRIGCEYDDDFRGSPKERVTRYHAYRIPLEPASPKKPSFFTGVLRKVFN